MCSIMGYCGSGADFGAFQRGFDRTLSRGPDDTRVVVDYLPNEPVAIVAGSETNLKITTQADMPIAENIARSLDPEHAKQEAKARMHAVFAEAFSQMHKH